MSTRKFFGTDGIRGRANTYPITAEVALRIGMAAGRYFKRGSHKHRVVLGKDTRRSSYMLETALMSGFSAMGVDVYTLGPVPTPAVGMLVKSLRADVGVMISASHNPHHDNGIKLFGPDGYKLSDAVEAEIEHFLTENAEPHLPEPTELGSMKRLDDGTGRYIEMAKATLPRELRFDGLKIVVDCAHGAAYKTAPAMLWELGADVETIGVSPNGFNINEGCGSTMPKRCQQAVIEHDADLGIALDGDADRVHIIDEKGQIVDGDQIMALIASSWARQGRLKGGALVATVMSNLGLERCLKDEGIDLLRTRVGDRYVVAEMIEKGCNVGGEQSGHIVLNDFATTGDGTIAALQVLAELRAQNRPASEVCAMFRPVPQLLRNVRFNQGESPLEHKSVKAAIKAGEEALAGTGRIVIRKSGTEPLIRVMAEGEDSAQVEQVVASICHAVSGIGDRLAAE